VRGRSTTITSSAESNDGRNCLDQAQWMRAGWEYRGMGKPVGR